MIMTYPTPPKTYSIRLAAKALSVSPCHIRRLCRAGKLKTVKLGARRLGIPAGELDRIAAAGVAA
jgi:excisionase family DNA binding protein